MEILAKLIDTAFIITLFYCLYTDLRYGKIYNFITIPLIIAGIGFNSYLAVSSNPAYLISSLYGVSLAFLLFIVFYFIGVLGGGDIKLFMGIGALKGHIFLIHSILFAGVVSFFLAGLVFLFFALRNYKFTGVLNLMILFFHNNVMVANEELKPILKKNLKFGISIVLGTVIAYIFLLKHSLF